MMVHQGTSRELLRCGVYTHVGNELLTAVELLHVVKFVWVSVDPSGPEDLDIFSVLRPWQEGVSWVDRV